MAHVLVVSRALSLLILPDQVSSINGNGFAKLRQGIVEPPSKTVEDFAYIGSHLRGSQLREEAGEGWLAWDGITGLHTASGGFVRTMHGETMQGDGILQVASGYSGKRLVGYE